VVDAPDAETRVLEDPDGCHAAAFPVAPPPSGPPGLLVQIVIAGGLEDTIVTRVFPDGRRQRATLPRAEWLDVIAKATLPGRTEDLPTLDPERLRRVEELARVLMTGETLRYRASSPGALDDGSIWITAFPGKSVTIGLDGSCMYRNGKSVPSTAQRLVDAAAGLD